MTRLAALEAACEHHVDGVSPDHIAREAARELIQEILYGRRVIAADVVAEEFSELTPAMRSVISEWVDAFARLEVAHSNAANLGEEQTLCELEYKLWRSLCNALEVTKLVTRKDLRASKLDTGTPGALLLLRIRECADRYTLSCQRECADTSR